ncbi:MAG: hypothetical protein LAT50_21425, partial [Ectothiorhodospiraceae bacterium]|nr:hypothetical protein [Ectothiorhodospiraceae bacterium]
MTDTTHHVLAKHLERCLNTASDADQGIRSATTLPELVRAVNLEAGIEGAIAVAIHYFEKPRDECMGATAMKLMEALGVAGPVSSRARRPRQRTPEGRWQMVHVLSRHQDRAALSVAEAAGCCSPEADPKAWAWEQSCV